MKVTNTTLKQVIDKDFKAYAMYTLQQRALPSAIDGMKIVNRKLIFGMIQDHKTGRVKVAEISGKMSSYDYAHGEVSAADAAINMAAPHQNNLSLLEPHGNFGSRLVQDAASPRYIHTSLSEGFKKHFIDFEVLPANIYTDQPEPTHYLPILPIVLVNGSDGIAVGFKTVILPRTVKTVQNAVATYLANPGKFMLDNTPLMPSFPQFRGAVTHVEDNKFATTGIVEYSGRYTYTISELPVGYDRAKYIEVLEELEEKELIKSYSDECSKAGFKFTVKVNGTACDTINKNPIKYFKLEKYFTELINCIDVKGKLIQFANARELIRYFAEYRLIKFGQKIEHDKQVLTERSSEYEWKKKFIQHVINNDIDFRKTSKQDLLNFIHSNVTVTEYAKRLLSVPLYECTTDAIAELDDKIKQLQKEYDVLDNTEPVEMFKRHLKSVL